MSEYLQGEIVRLSIGITDVANVLVDPVTVTLKIKTASGITTQNYPGTIERVALGVYRYDLPLLESGRHLWRWESSLPHQSAAQGQLFVNPSNI